MGLREPSVPKWPDQRSGCLASVLVNRQVAIRYGGGTDADPSVTRSARTTRTLRLCRHEGRPLPAGRFTDLADGALPAIVGKAASPSLRR